jgi:hemoglobin
MPLEVRSLPVLFLVLAACAATPSAPSGAEGAPASSAGTLYQRLGGKEGIDAVVATFVANVGRDQRIQLRFLFTDLDGLRAHLSAQICEATGGPCKYTGKPMKSGHAGMHISNAEFDAMAEDLAAALKAHGVGALEQQQLLGAISGMRADIVEASSP